MSISAIATKELSAIGQRRWMYFIRTGYVVCLALAVALVSQTRQWSDLASTGRRLFSMLVHAQLMLTAILCSTAASSSMSGERETGALPLLIVSTLRPWQIVVGKAVACAAAVGITVLSTLPLLALTTLYGGVSLWQVLTASGCLVAAFVAGSSIGVFFSAKCKTESGAAAATFVSLVVWMWVLPGLLPLGALRDTVSLSNPWSCFGRTLAIGPGGALAPLLCLPAAALIAGLCLLAASRSVSRIKDSAPTSSRPPRKKQPSRPVWGCSRLFWEISGLGAIPRASGLIRSQTLLGGMLVLGTVAVALLRSVSGDASARSLARRGHAEAWLTLCLGIVSLILLIAAVQALISCAGHFIRLRSNGTLPLVLVTPLSDRRVVLAPLVGHLALIIPGALALALLSLPARAMTENWTISGWLIRTAWTALRTVHALAWTTFALQCALTASVSYKSQLAAVLSTLLLVWLTWCTVGIVLATGPTLLAMAVSLVIAAVGILIQLKYVATKLRSARGPT